MASLNSVAPLLRELWTDTMNTAFSNEIVLLSRIEDSPDGVRTDASGRYTIIPVHVTRNQGIGSRPEHGILPLPGRQGYVGARVTARAQHIVGSVTSHTLALADGDPRSFAVAIDREFEGMRNDARKDYARMVWSPFTGELAEVTAVNGDTVSVDKVMYLSRNMVIDSVDNSDPANPALNASERVIESVTYDEDFDGGHTKDIVLDDATGVSVGDILVRHGNFNQEIQGMFDLIDDEEPIQNIDPDDVEEWKSLIIGKDRDAEPWNEVEAVRANQLIYRRTGRNISAMYSGDGVQRAIFSELKQNREFVNTQEFAHGFTALPLAVGTNTFPLFADPDYPEDFGAEEGSITGVDESMVSIFREESGWHFSEETGSMFYRSQDRTDSFEFHMRQFSQLGVHLRNCHFRIENLQTAEYQGE